MWCDILDVWDDHVIVIGFTTCMLMSMTTGRSHRSCLNLLYEMQRHVLTTFTSLLTGSYSSSDSSSWRDDFTETRWWRSWCGTGEDGDHDCALVMEIKKHKFMAISCHLWSACDVNPFMHLILLRTTVALWGDLSLKFQDEIVFSPTVHCCYSSSFRDTTWWSGVIDSTFTYNGCKTVAHAEHSG